MPNSPSAIVDALQSLHEAEQGSVFRLMGEDSPYVAKAPDEVRRPLTRLKEVNGRHIEELAGAIRHLGGEPVRRRPGDATADNADPYLKYLSLKFLIPKLLNEKELMIRRYENTLRALPKTAPPDVTELLRRQRAEQESHVDALTDAAQRALAAGK